MRGKEYPQNPRSYSRRPDDYVRPPTTRQQLKVSEPQLAEGNAALIVTLSTKAHTLTADQFVTLNTLLAVSKNVPNIENSRSRLQEAKLGISLLKKVGEALVEREERINKTPIRV